MKDEEKEKLNTELCSQGGKKVENWQENIQVTFFFLPPVFLYCSFGFPPKENQNCNKINDMNKTPFPIFHRVYPVLYTPRIYLAV
jgi:hypothetical protein